MTAPGLIGTVRDFFFLGSNDTSVAARQNDLPIVERMVGESPWVGHGPGTYLAEVPADNLDNQYFGMLIEFGVIGTAAITLAYLLLPAIVAFAARKRIGGESARALGAALGGAALVGLVVAATFDSLGFPMYAGAFALVVGMIGGYWRLADTSPRTDTPDLRRPTAWTS
jgi:O-antigen ligase